MPLKTVFYRFYDVICRHFESIVVLKDTRREKAPSNKTPALRISTNMGVWVVRALNQLLIRSS